MYEYVCIYIRNMYICVCVCVCVCVWILLSQKFNITIRNIILKIFVYTKILIFFLEIREENVEFLTVRNLISHIRGRT